MSGKIATAAATPVLAGQGLWPSNFGELCEHTGQEGVVPAHFASFQSAKSLLEAGDDLLSYFAFPKAMRKSLRSTNALENLNREFRRRTKTQASFSNEQGAVTLLYGLIAFGQIRMRKINGHQSLADLIQRQADQAA